MSSIEREIRFLKIYAGVSTAICVVLFSLLFRGVHARKFQEIEVERINIVEADGRLRMVLSNKARQHPGVVDGVTFEERQGKRPPGLMFFNEKGDELGGLVFDGNSAAGQGGSLTFDKFRGDQTIQFIHEERPDESYFAGLKMSDQNLPLLELIERQKEISKLATKEDQDAAFRQLQEQGLMPTERLRLGRDYDKASVIKLKDAQGRSRIELRVDANGDARLNFFDELGKVTFSLPPAP